MKKRRIESGELKKIQLEILDVVSEFCNKHEINYWLDSGTLLGAIRHGGYIPWDDDIDIGMLRVDYEKFKKLFNSENGRYRFNSFDNDKSFLYQMGKVMDTETVLYEPDENGFKLSVNIDIFVYDNALDKNDALKRFKLRNKYRVLHEHRNHKIAYRGNVIAKLMKKLFKIMLTIFPKHHFIGKLYKNATKNADKETNYIANFMGWNPAFCEKSAFSEFIDWEFENKKYKIPIGYDKWLTAHYGDYMKLPPEEERITHHSFVAYYK